MTEDEKQSIISEILSAIRTNSLTIEDLTQLETMPSDAYIEISGGRRISCEILKQAVASMFEEDIDEQNRSIANLTKAIGDEAKRAADAEAANARNITAETNRAQQAESNLTKAIGDEAKRAADAENELKARMMGTSTVSNSNTDPYKYLGMMSYEELNNTLDSLTYDATVIGKNFGYFRAKVDYRDVEIKNILLSSSLNIIVQIVEGMFILFENKLSISDNTYSILMRKCIDGVWGDWAIVMNSSTTNTINNLSIELLGIKRSVGQASGIAPLGTDGKVSEAYLPVSLNDVLVFDDFTSSLNLEARDIPELADSSKYTPIHFNTQLGYFVVYNPEDGLYYLGWNARDLFQDNTIPHSGKIFICKKDNRGYFWNGTQLNPIGSDLVLGETEKTAFPGNRGVALEKSFEILNDTTSRFNLTVINYNVRKKCSNVCIVRFDI